MNSSLIGKETIARSTSAPFSMSNQCRMFYPSEQKIPRTMIAEALLNGKAEWYGSPAIVYVETSEQFEKNTYPTTPETYLAALGSVSPEMARAQGKSVEELQAALDYKKQHMPKFEKIHMLWSEKPCNMNCWDGGFRYQDAIRAILRTAVEKGRGMEVNTCRGRTPGGVAAHPGPLPGLRRRDRHRRL